MVTWLVEEDQREVDWSQCLTHVYFWRSILQHGDSVNDTIPLSLAESSSKQFPAPKVGKL